METKNEEIQKVEKSQKANKEPKICKECGSCENHFGLRRNSLCTPCRSKKSNSKTNSKNYLKTYYEKNKLKMQNSDKDYKIVKTIVTKIVVEF